MMNGTDVALDHTIQLTNVWLKRLATDHHLGEKHLGAQLPILVRGIYYEGWHLSECPRSDRHVDEFLAHVAAELLPMFPCDALGVAKAVFDLLWKELDSWRDRKGDRRLTRSASELVATNCEAMKMPCCLFETAEGARRYR